MSGAEWKRYRRPAQLRTSCKETADSRETALELLAAAGGDCLDVALRAVGRHAPQDLAAAHLTRFERASEPDPMDLLQAWDTTDKFNRALALERLRLTKEAIQAWDDVVREGSGWAQEAIEHRDRLQALPDPADQWENANIDAALKRRDQAALAKIAADFPAAATRHFEKLIRSDFESARLLAAALTTVGEHYPKTVIDAMQQLGGHEVVQQAIAAIREKNHERAVAMLVRAGNPLHLTVRYHEAAKKFINGEDALPLLDPAVPHLKPEYRELSSRIQSLRANALEYRNHYLQAHTVYEDALASAQGEPTGTAEALHRRSSNYATIGDAEKAFRDAYGALSLLDRVADMNARHQTYSAAATAARQLEHPLLALFYENAAVEVSQKMLSAAGTQPDKLATAKRHLAIALRARADIHVELGNDDAAEEDLKLASDLADAAAEPNLRAQLQMRVHEVRGQARLKKRPNEAVQELTHAIGLAETQDSTYRAVLYSKRAAARRNAGDAAADEDLAEALRILRDEAKNLIEAVPRGQYEALWAPYFSRFQTIHQQMIESRIAARDPDGAFVYAETARALEPMQILLQSQLAPDGFQAIKTKEDLRLPLNDIPDDTVVLHYLVLPDKTYTWILTRGKIEGPYQQSIGEAKIKERVDQVLKAVEGNQPELFTTAMRAAFSELFRDPLKRVPDSKTRIVIIPDGPMHGLPFNGLQGLKQEGYLIDRGPISVAGSTSLYLYALARDRAFRAGQTPSVLLVSDPELDPRLRADYPILRYAQEEVRELAGDHYGGAKVLAGAEATVPAFLEWARNATIIHFAGHGVAMQQPWQSRLLLAPRANEGGELTAERLMKELSELERTRLVVLGACSTAGGAPVGPQGLAPLVRPLIAANVPAVVGSLWDVKDATTKDLLVSLHCHYRHGDDVAQALRQAQLRLRNQQPAMTWAAFQVVGYAGSPWSRPVALEEPSSEHVCTQNSLHGPDGLHSQ